MINPKIVPYISKYDRISGENYSDVERKVRKVYNSIAKQTKRNPYVRSKYFHKEKIFLKVFWDHINQKYRGERRRRFQLYNCALDLLRNTTNDPEIKLNPNKSEILYRFYGKSKSGNIFYVQVKEDIRTSNKYWLTHKTRLLPMLKYC